MKKKIAILGSTGSIGKASLEVISKNKSEFKITLLSANSNYFLIKHYNYRGSSFYNYNNGFTSCRFSLAKSPKGVNSLSAYIYYFYYK